MLKEKLAKDSQDKEVLEGVLQNEEQRLQELEEKVATEQNAHEEAVKGLGENEKMSINLTKALHSYFILWLSAEREALEDTKQRLHSEEETSNELRILLAAEREAHEVTRCLIAVDWVLDRSDILLSENVIGVAGWGRVMEGTFRGCKVAVKQIHELILSPYNRRLFEREMTIASRCRHPCLLQFIGATNDDQSPLFLTELLDTSLRAVLHERALKPAEITAIALDVAKALNYLHLNQPTPIIHRDISSANVLLWKHWYLLAWESIGLRHC